eukprot:CAMPEP_0183333520 /NCGR_PEP_ID=MMETSP0164_2-20130417/2400_1 /TAXON_ID=221442 /ORGANISM="Coccolithus pelagicus ssp braarudi, Strain PLY182g" /LENGTH=64 /DNA_ID=CAMNT_0025502463 /DNA_START=370 /DNA_END=564 /DNA_ORIENTATION=-
MCGSPVAPCSGVWGSVRQCLCVSPSTTAAEAALRTETAQVTPLHPAWFQMDTRGPAANYTSAAN